MEILPSSNTHCFWLKTPCAFASPGELALRDASRLEANFVIKLTLSQGSRHNPLAH
jgi:hypothetical protein